MTPDEFRRHGYAMIDLIADYRQNIEQRAVQPLTTPGEIKASLPANAPEKGEPFEDIISDVEKLVMPGLLHWQHPNFFGYFPSNVELSSVLGDCLSTGLGVIGLSWQSSPALTEIEEVTTHWLLKMIGLSDEWSGVIQDSASTSTLIALISARERTSDYVLMQEGILSSEAPLIVYTSPEAHSAVNKAAMLAGFGLKNIRLIATDENHALSPLALELAIEQDLAQGNRPCIVIATTGTTAATVMDPIDAMGDICQRYGLWLHVDSAMAGSAMILPEFRYLWHGIEKADSVVLNPHKWLGAAFDCSVYCVRDTEHLIRIMSTNPSFLQSNADGQVRNYRDWGIPLGRRFRALKLWFLIREQGVEGLQARLRRDIAHAQWLAEQIEKHQDWQLVAPLTLQTLCVRHQPAGLSDDALDTYTRTWAEKFNQSGKGYVTPATLSGRWMVRISIGTLGTERRHVEGLWSELQALVSEITI
ncbi:beta-eliminating lyase family protein [Yersinia ruckeri]|uniref:pyridoxal phosphate-dependent decarboxylase family protein n=1 Tax=Yersinia ruckeri TaxID=29486 RepID=UPI0005ABFFF4|nr:aminotransferase class V-fold PLP-dependent enzyme [Yersinia ruckeri]AJI95590.1 beta-eliminating lyase family protein [Yersinia ruckeri]MCW6568428.1 aminotransferase class V-fold PLP-dependent enzyme [Yersinia ruckeri]